MSRYRAYDKDDDVPVIEDTGVRAAYTTEDSTSADFASIDPESGVKRGLKTRHLSMMALAGIIGPGLLIGAGGALSNGGPASLLIGFAVIGIIAFSIMQSLGELTTLYPSGGAFTGLADRFVDKAFGVALGWNYYIIWMCVLANEYNVLSSIFVFWSDKVPLWGYFLIFWVCLMIDLGYDPANLQESDSLPWFPASWGRGIRRGRVLAGSVEVDWPCGLLHLLYCVSVELDRRSCQF